MGGLGIYRCDSRKPSSLCGQSRLQVPVANNKTCVSQLQQQRSLNRHDSIRPLADDKSLSGSSYNEQLSPLNKKNLPGRSVSFRESDMTNYSRSKRVARSRPGSLRNSRPDYSRLRSGSCSNADSGHLRPDALLPTSSRRSSFRMPSRQASIRENRLTARRTSTSGDSIPSLPPPSPRSRSVVIHRIPIHTGQQQHRQQRQQQETDESKSFYCRSASLSSDPMTRGWRSTIAKLIRAKSTSGNSVGSNGTDCSSPSSKSRRLRIQSSLAVDLGQHMNEKLDAEVSDHTLSSGGSNHPSSSMGSSGVNHSDSHIDICVIQATPAASPCASIRSTLSGDSLEMAAIKSIPPYTTFKQPAMSVRDRRRCFARMKGQTIDHDNEILTIDTSFLAPPTIEYSSAAGHGMNPSSLLAHPLADLRSRSTSPVRHPATSWLQVFNNEPNLNARANCHPPTTKKSHPVAVGGKSPALSVEHLGVSQFQVASVAHIQTHRPTSQQSVSPNPSIQHYGAQFPF